MRAASVAPEIRFRRLSAAAVRAALTDPGEKSAVTREVTRLVQSYAAGEKPFHPRWPIEAVALDLVNAAISKTIASHHERERAVLVPSILAAYPAEDANAWRKVVVAEAVSRVSAEGMTLEEWHAAAIGRLRLNREG
jgi:hypothetical protein